tara:strand:- start:379 stop:510 length:132 start_codon:yes stop_codon:yes gene_type:complete
MALVLIRRSVVPPGTRLGRMLRRKDLSVKVMGKTFTTHNQMEI